MIIKVRQTRTPGHDHLMFWMGKREGNLANVGQLIMKPDEAEALLWALQDGVHGPNVALIVQTDG